MTVKTNYLAFHPLFGLSLSESPFFADWNPIKVSSVEELFCIALCLQWGYCEFSSSSAIELLNSEIFHDAKTTGQSDVKQIAKVFEIIIKEHIR